MTNELIKLMLSAWFSVVLSVLSPNFGTDVLKYESTYKFTYEVTKILMAGKIIVRIIVNTRIKLRMQQMQNQNHDKEENHALDALIWYLYANIIHYKIRNEFTWCLI